MTPDYLTPREQEILQLLDRGLTNQEIASQLFITVHTVKDHNSNIYEKLGVKNRVGAVRKWREIQRIDQHQISKPAVMQLPRMLTDFIGREQAINQICELLHTKPLVTITGPGGIGKTRLAIEVARRFAQTTAIPVFFVPLREYQGKDALPIALSHTLNMQIHSHFLLDAVITNLSEHQLLLLLDNMEHLQEDVPHLERLLKAVPGLQVLVTSREYLKCYGEQICALTGLSTHTHHLKGNQPYENEAIALFVNRARQINAHFSPSPAELELIRQICIAVEGMPLAIEHAATLTHLFDLPTLAASMKEDTPILKTSMPGMDRRDHNMHNVIANSWKMLTSEQQQALQCLSIFQGGFQRDAALFVAGADSAMLSGLLMKSLIYRSTSERYSIHELHRQFIAEQLRDEHEIRRIMLRYVQFYANLLHKLSPYSPEEHFALCRPKLERLREEYSNIRQAILWSLEHERGYHALEIIAGGSDFFARTYHNPEIIAWARQGLATSPDNAVLTKARCAFVPALHSLDLAEIRQFLKFANQSEDTMAIGNALHTLGIYYMIHDQVARAEMYHQKALQVFTDAGFSGSRSIALNHLGLTAERRGDMQQAIQYYRESIATAEKVGIVIAVRHMILAAALIKLGEELEALVHFGQALEQLIMIAPTQIRHYGVCFELIDYLMRKGRLKIAVRLSACIHADRASMLLPESEELAGIRSSLRKQVEDSEFEREWQIGTQLPMEEVFRQTQIALDKLKIQPAVIFP